jgi:uncharacterized protein with FMN-binding domain
MRRTTAAVVGPLVGAALLLMAKLGVDQASGAPLATDPAATAGPVPVPSDVDGTADVATSRPAPATPAAPGGQPSPSRSRTVRPTTPSRATGGLRDGTFAGNRSTNQYGTIQVTITVSGGRMTAVAVSYPTTPSRTADINARAVPRLRQGALTAQSANVSTVSGATYTSRSFIASLQSALTAAKG